MISKDKIQSLQTEYEELKKEIYDPAKMTNRRYYSKISKRFKELENILQCNNMIIELEQTITDNNELIETEEDEELKELAMEENTEIQLESNRKKKSWKTYYLPKIPIMKKTL